MLVRNTFELLKFGLQFFSNLLKNGAMYKRCAASWLLILDLRGHILEDVLLLLNVWFYITLMLNEFKLCWLIGYRVSQLRKFS